MIRLAIITQLLVFSILARAEEPLRLAANIEGGKLRVYLLAADGSRTLIRSRSDTRKSLSESERQQISAAEAQAAQPWLAAKAAVDSKALTPAQQQNLWLDVSERLEAVLAKDPDHLGVLRDLLLAYSHLLSFEGTSSFGAAISEMAAKRLAEFATRATPLDARDRALTIRLRAWLLLVMELYPTAVEVASGDPPTQSELRAVLEPFGQGRYTARGTFRVGPMNVGVFKTDGNPPSEKLLWGELFFIASSSSNDPDRTVGYVLTKKDGRYYLYFRSIRGSQIAALYGATRPSDDDVRRTVQSLISTALKRR